MASQMFQLLSKRIIKPSSPTPPQLRNYKLSLKDQLMASKYMPLALFYPKECFQTSHGAGNDPSQDRSTSLLLEKSLSSLLTLYRPFAGRLVDNKSFNCDDTGVIFREARIRCTMSEILRQPPAVAENAVFPSGLQWNDVLDEDGALVVSQLSHFDCGGKALTLCISHKLGDATVLVNFAGDWATLTRHQLGQKPASINPHFTAGPALFPPSDDVPPLVYSFEANHQLVPTRFAFDEANLNRLKATVAAESGVQNPTRSEVVAALLTRSSWAAASQMAADSQPFKPVVLRMPANLRPLTNPPLPLSSMGNLMTTIIVLIQEEGDMTSLPRLVSKIRKEKVEFHEKHKAMKASELLSDFFDEKKKLMETSEYEAHLVSSICNFPIYNIDFGWGRPERVSLASVPAKNFTGLVDDPTGKGVEALTSLDQQVLSKIQRDHELLSFASMNPSL